MLAFEGRGVFGRNSKFFSYVLVRIESHLENETMVDSKQDKLEKCSADGAFKISE